MIRGTSRKQTGRVTERRKASPPRKRFGSQRTSRQEAKPRASSPARTKVRGNAVPQPAVRKAGPEHQAALKDFETAIRFFQKKDYGKAAALFGKITEGPVREIADRARVHLHFCERKRQQESTPKTAEAYYAHGVAALNSRDIERALQYLSKSNKMKPGQEYVHYALAAAYGLQGDPDNALSHLATAIKLRPQNRGQARHDEDFQVLAEDPRFTQLLGIDARRS